MTNLNANKGTVYQWCNCLCSNYQKILRDVCKRHFGKFVYLEIFFISKWNLPSYKNFKFLGLNYQQKIPDMGEDKVILHV